MKQHLIGSFFTAALVLSAGGMLFGNAVAKENSNPDIGGGKVLLYTTQGKYLGAANVGSLPDMVLFSQDGGTLLTANEGEPSDDYTRDPKGSISIITLDKAVDGLVEDVTTLTFDNATVPSDVRIKPGAAVANDLEPEYIAMNAEGTKAWVTLQENNGLAIVDVKKKQIVSVRSLGAKDFDRIDIDAKDGANVAKTPASLYGLYQPDTIIAYQVNGKDYIVTANEGDDREYDAWEDYAKASSLQEKKKAAFSDQLIRDILEVKGKKKLSILKDLGKDSQGRYTSFYLAGTRSFSIWDGDGNQVFDSGSQFEEYLAGNYADQFNTRVDDTDDTKDIAELQKDGVAYEMIGDKAYFWEGVDARSQKKGCEPEALALAKIDGRIYAYIGLEKQGGFFIYDISDPRTPKMIDYFNDIDYSRLPSESGDLAPEGMITFEQGGHHYLAVAHELSSSVALYQLGTEGRATKLFSLVTGTFGEGAAEIVDYDPAGKKLYVTNGEKKLVDIIDVADPSKPKMSGKIDFSEHGKKLQSVAVRNGLVAIAVKRKK